MSAIPGTVDQSHEEKSEPIRRPSQIQPFVRTTTELHKTVPKGTVNRPIAPAQSGNFISYPGLQLSAPTSQVVGTQALSQGIKLQSVVMGNQVGASGDHHQVTAVNLSTPSPSISTSSTTHATPLQQQQQNLQQVQMASLIRTGHVVGHNIPVTFQSHMPRGPAAASAIGTAPKGTAILRHPVSHAITSGSTVVGLPQQLQQPRAILPVQASIPAARSTSPAVVQAAAAAATHEQSRNILHPTTSATTVQITIQQPARTMPQNDTPTVRAVTPQQGLTKVTAPTQPILQGAPQVALPSQQKVVAHMQNVGVSQANTQPKINQTVAMNLAAQHNIQRKKIVPGQPLISPVTQHPSKGGVGGQHPTITPTIHRGQKIIVTQSPTQHSVQSSTIITTTAKTPNLGGALNLSQPVPRQKVIYNMQPQAAAPLNAIPKNVTPATVAIQNVGAQHPSVTTAITTVTSIPVAKVPPVHRTVQGTVEQHREGIPSHAPVSAQTAAAFITQRASPSTGAHQIQQAGTQLQQASAQLQHGGTQLQHGGTQLQHGGAQMQQSSAQIQHGAQIQQVSSHLQQGSAQLQQVSSHLQQTAAQLQQGGATTTTVAASAAQTDTTRATSEVRPQFQGMIPGYTDYQQLYGTVLNQYMYQQVAAAQGLSTSVRPAFLTNQPNLAASLSAAAAQQGVAVTTPGRVNPMINIDPSRHQSISAAHTQQIDHSKVKGPHLVSSDTSGHHPPIASSIQQHTAAVLHNTTANQIAPPSNLSASPRPSILRKRPANDSTAIAAVKKNLLGSALTDPKHTADTALSQSAMSPRPPVSPATHKNNILDPNRENSQSSTDTASSAESTPVQNNTENKPSIEPTEAQENGGTVSASAFSAFNSITNNMEASPRKKPRKQLLNANEELKDGLSTDDEIEKFSQKVNAEREKEKERLEQEDNDDDDLLFSGDEELPEEYIDDEGVRWTREKTRPSVNLMVHDHCTWKPKNNHYQRYTDVKPKEERRPTVNELANQKGINQKTSGWKMYHLAAQFEEMIDTEKDIKSRLLEIQEQIAPKHIAKTTMEDDIGMVHELSQGIIQRCQLFADQINEAKGNMIQILDHKKRILDIVNKHHSKRPVKKKER